MAAKLKTLKVAELKDILTTAAVPFTQRANKSDLIAKIVASPAALNAFNAIHAPERVSHQKPEQPPQNDDLVRVLATSSFV
jgi:SAP domain-containing ribonucleoprotein